MTQPPFDPFEVEIFGYGLEAIVDQMGATLLRAAYSPLIRDSLDYACAINAHDGRLIAQGVSIPMNIAATEQAVSATVSRLGGSWAAGDVAILNDPYDGGTHLNDVFIVAPVLYESQVACYVVAVAHQVDIGGAVPGSMWTHASDIWGEGIRLRPTKIREGGSPNGPLIDLLADNVRVPVQLFGDLDAMIGACLTGVDLLLGLLNDIGPHRFHSQVGQLWDQTNNEALAALGELRLGTYAFQDWIDGDGASSDSLVVSCTVTMRKDGVSVDFAGTSPQVGTALNSPLTFTRSCAAIAVRCLLPNSVRNNDGFLRLLQVDAPFGSILNPKFPAPCGNRGLTGFRVFDTVMGALSQTGSERIRAAGEGGTLGVGIGGVDDRGDRFVVRLSQLGTWGAGPISDGVEGVSNPCANMDTHCIELIEEMYPLRVLRRELVADTGGAGRFRGGLAIECEIVLLCESATVSLRCDRRLHPPYGLEGGMPGSPAGVWLRQEKELGELPAMGSIIIHRGEAVVTRLAGGGGFGEPALRDPVAIVTDIEEGKLTLRGAAADYGFILDRQSSAS